MKHNGFFIPASECYGASKSRKLKSMPHSLLKRLLISLPLLATPMFAAGQSNIDYSFSAAQLCTLDDAGQVGCTLAAGYERLQPPSSLPAS